MPDAGQRRTERILMTLLAVVVIGGMVLLGLVNGW